MNLTFKVYGIPQPQGSMKAFMPKGAKFPVVTGDNAKTKPWRQAIAQTAIYEMERQEFTPLLGKQPVLLEAVFCFDKPKSAGKKVRHKVTRPDVDKLARSLLDALTGIVFADDSQVANCGVRKLYDSPARVEVSIWELV